MTTIRDLPKSLLDAASEVIATARTAHLELKEKTLADGLKYLGVASTDNLTEQQSNRLYNWIQTRLQETSCVSVESDIKPLLATTGDMSAVNDSKQDFSLSEGIAIDADEVATNGAVGVTNTMTQPPIHADVLRDFSPVEGKTEFRLFVQFNTNTLPIIIPPVTLPGAPTLDSLRGIVEGLPFFCAVCEKALADAADIPHERPEHRGTT